MEVGQVFPILLKKVWDCSLRKKYVRQTVHPYHYRVLSAYRKKLYKLPISLLCVHAPTHDEKGRFRVWPVFF